MTTIFQKKKLCTHAYLSPVNNMKTHYMFPININLLANEDLSTKCKMDKVGILSPMYIYMQGVVTWMM